jgi:hypothetical protein
MHQMWRTEPNGDLSAIMLNLRLVIHEGDRYSRFLLLSRSRVGSRNHEVLLESGCEDDVPAAKARAIRRAVSLTSPPTVRRPRR